MKSLGAYIHKEDGHVAGTCIDYSSDELSRYIYGDQTIWLMCISAYVL